MQNYLTTFTNTNALAFPNTAAINASGGAATDGTEFIAAMVNDSMWGVWQALLNYTGQTPNGIVESISNSQILEALRRFETPGKIISVVWNDDPAVLGIRALQLTGQGILRANYSELDDIVYVGDTDNPTAATFYHADDAAGVTRNTAGVYLILPDARGRVVRGLDLTGSVDPDGASRELGDFQDDAFQGWQLSLRTRDDGGSDNTRLANSNGANPATTNTGAVSSIIDGGYGTPRISTESRMINLSANLMITY